MSSKHLRRVLQEKTDKIDEVNNRTSEDEDEEFVSAPRVNKFAFLNDSPAASSQNSSSEAEEKLEPIREESNKKAKNKKRKTEKKKNRRKKSTEIEDLDVLAKEILKPGLCSNFVTIFIEPNKTEQQLNINELFKIDPRSLDPDVELRRILGPTFRGTDAQQQQQQQVPNNARVLKLSKSKIVKVGLWPPIRIYMSLEKTEDNVKWYRFHHNESYQILQQHFWLYQKQMDHESIMNSILVKNPYHLDSLLLLAEIMRVQEDVQNSRDAIAMGIYACESAFHSSFQLLSYEHRLSYEWRENRAFFLLLHWHSFNLQQKRCFGTALQFAKILFCKMPDSDPLATLLVIDSIALKAKDYMFLINFYKMFEKEKNLDKMPNFLFSMSLAYYFLSSQQSSNTSNNAKIKNEDSMDYLVSSEEFLEKALCRFPFILGQILDKLQIQPDSKVDKCYPMSSLAYHSKILCDVYLHHTLELWKQPNVLSWLEYHTIQIASKFSGTLKTIVDEWTEKRNRSLIGMPLNIQRHLILYSIKNEVVSDENSSLVDPCPPIKTFSEYQPTDFEDILRIGGAPTNEQSHGNVLTEFVRSLVPDEYQPHIDSQLNTLRNYAENMYDRIVMPFQQLELFQPGQENQNATETSEANPSTSTNENSTNPADNTDEKVIDDNAEVPGSEQ